MLHTVYWLCTSLHLVSGYILIRFGHRPEKFYMVQNTRSSTDGQREELNWGLEEKWREVFIPFLLLSDGVNIKPKTVYFLHYTYDDVFEAFFNILTDYLNQNCFFTSLVLSFERKQSKKVFQRFLCSIVNPLSAIIFPRNYLMLISRF